MSEQTNKKGNGWKVAFFVLFLLNIFLAIGVYYSLLSVNEKLPTIDQSSSEVSSQSIQTEVTLSSDDLELLLQKGTAELNNELVPLIEVDEKIKLTGMLKVLGLPIQYLIQGEPFTMENGNLQLKVDEIKLGNLSLPVKQSLQILESQIDPNVPLEVDKESTLIYILFSNIHTDKIQKIKLVEINKEKKEYTFEITMPLENLLQ